MNPVLIFDFDGTIADTYDLALSIGRKLSDEFGIRQLSNDEVGLVRTMSFGEAIRYLKIPLYKVPKLVIRMRSEISRQIGTIKPFKGIPEVLRRFHERGYTLGLLTSNSKQNVWNFLERYELTFFAFGSYSSSILGKTIKIKQLLHKQKFSNTTVIYIGDTKTDIEACRKAHIRVAGVTWGYGAPEHIEASHPDFLITSPSELLELV